MFFSESNVYAEVGLDLVIGRANLECFVRVTGSEYVVFSIVVT